MPIECYCYCVHCYGSMASHFSLVIDFWHTPVALSFRVKIAVDCKSDPVSPNNRHSVAALPPVLHSKGNRSDPIVDCKSYLPNLY